LSHKTFCGSLIRPIKKFILSGSLREYQRTSSNKKRREEKRREEKRKEKKRKKKANFKPAHRQFFLQAFLSSPGRDEHLSLVYYSVCLPAEN